MKFTVDRLHLNDALTQLKKFVGRASLPALSGIHITVTDAGMLVLRATDLDAWVTARISSTEVRDQQPGSALLPMTLLKKMIKGGSFVTIESFKREDNAFANVIVDDMASELRLMPIEDFPEWREVTGTHTEVNADLLSRVVTAASSDVSRPVLTGVLIEGTGMAAATDSYRLQVARIAPDGIANIGDGGLLVPASSAKIAAKWDDLVLTVGDDEHAQFTGALTKGPKRKPRLTVYDVIATPIDGQFPSWRKLLPDPDESTTTVLIDEVQPVLDALARMTALARTSRNVPVKTNFTDHGIEFELGHRELGVSKWEVNARLIGEEIDTAFNPGYMQDALRAVLGTGDVSVGLRGHLKPAVFRTEHFTALLMPMRIN